MNSQNNTSNGKRCGQTHPAAKLTDSEVEMLRELHEKDGWGYKKLAAKFDIGKSTARDLCKYLYR